MPRKKSELRRTVILETAKRLFSAEGFERTSMSLLAKSMQVPVGSVYTYFPSKDALLSAIVEEGWSQFIDMVESGFTRVNEQIHDKAERPLQKISFLVSVLLPELFRDADLIAILLSESGKPHHLDEKLSYLSTLIAGVLDEFQAAESGRGDLDSASIRTGLSVMLLGSLETVRLNHQTGLAIDQNEIIRFLVASVEHVLGCRLPAPSISF
ncbi:MAG: TetR/AcrR family transcriptional regulator [Spirochaetia bacterium]|nr:TetR/AcrR family transcriptional regulator [Spirochaetia bacterium]